MTLSAMVVDLGNIFERGQLYTALSRAESLDTMRVKNFKRKHVMVSKRVLDFYARVRDVTSKEGKKRDRDV
jgi:ATP-dependent DNA helicase PIF1